MAMAKGRTIIVAAMLLASVTGQTLPELSNGCYYTTSVITSGPGSFSFSSMTMPSTTITTTSTVTVGSPSSATSASSLSTNGDTNPTLQSPGPSSTVSTGSRSSTSRSMPSTTSPGGLSTGSTATPSISSAVSSDSGGSSGSSVFASSSAPSSASTPPAALSSGSTLLTTTIPATISDTSTSTASPSAGPPPDIQPGDEFNIEVAGLLTKVKRATSYIAFMPSGTTYVTSNKDLAAVFVIDLAGNLLSDGQYIGTSSSDGTAALQSFPNPPVSPFFWSVEDGVVTFGFASFCVTATEQTFVVYDSPPALGCREVEFVADLVPVETTTTASTNTTTTQTTTSFSASRTSSSATISPQSSSLTSSLFSTVLTATTSRTVPPSASLVIPTVGPASSSSSGLSTSTMSSASAGISSSSTSRTLGPSASIVIPTFGSASASSSSPASSFSTSSSFSSPSSSSTTSARSSLFASSSGSSSSASGTTSAQSSVSTSFSFSSPAASSGTSAQASVSPSTTISTSLATSSSLSQTLSATTFSTSSRPSTSISTSSTSRIQCSVRPSPKPSSYPEVPKRGLAYGNVSTLQFYTPPSQISWAYNYFSLPNDSNSNNRGPYPPSQNPNITFYPLLFNDNPTLTTIWEANVNFAITHYGTDAIMSFNEPDLCIDGSSCMTVSRALAAYERYIQPFAECGIRLAAPAITNTADGTTWLLQFLGNATERNLTIDIINLHWYASPYNQQYFQDYMTEKYVQFGRRPVWITEYGMDQAYEEAAVLQFLRNTTYWVEQQPWIEKTAWFGNYRNNLLNADGSALSQRGQVWNSFRGNGFVYGFNKRGVDGGEGVGGVVERPEGLATMENLASFKNLQMEESFGGEWLESVRGGGGAEGEGEGDDEGDE